jgi:hypothetical protein
MRDTTLNELFEDMRGDQEEGSTYYAWQSNIAMAIYDTLGEKVTLDEANECARRFLDILTKSGSYNDLEDL